MSVTCSFLVFMAAFGLSSGFLNQAAAQQNYFLNKKDSTTKKKPFLFTPPQLNQSVDRTKLDTSRLAAQDIVSGATNWQTGGPVLYKDNSHVFKNTMSPLDVASATSFIQSRQMEALRTIKRKNVVRIKPIKTTAEMVEVLGLPASGLPNVDVPVITPVAGDSQPVDRPNAAAPKQPAATPAPQGEVPRLPSFILNPNKKAEDEAPKRRLLFLP